MKYLIIIIIFFVIIFYYNLVLSKTNVRLIEKEKKYKYLKRKIDHIKKEKNRKEPKTKKVDFILDNIEQDNMVDSIFSIDNEHNNENINDNMDANSFGLESYE